MRWKQKALWHNDSGTLFFMHWLPPHKVHFIFEMITDVYLLLLIPVLSKTGKGMTEQMYALYESKTSKRQDFKQGIEWHIAYGDV